MQRWGYLYAPVVYLFICLFRSPAIKQLQYHLYLAIKISEDIKIVITLNRGHWSYYQV